MPFAADIRRRIAGALHAAAGHLRGVAARLSGTKTVGVRAVILRAEDREVLLIRHTYRPGWHTPGGGVQAGETPDQAIRREVLEEAGLTIADPPTLFGVYQHRWRGADDYPILYVVRRFTGEAATRDPMEIAEVRWFAVDTLPPDATPKTRARLAEVLSGRPLSDRW